MFGRNRQPGDERNLNGISRQALSQLARTVIKCNLPRRQAVEAEDLLRPVRRCRDPDRNEPFPLGLAGLPLQPFLERRDAATKVGTVRPVIQWADDELQRPLGGGERSTTHFSWRRRAARSRSPGAGGLASAARNASRSASPRIRVEALSASTSTLGWSTMVPSGVTWAEYPLTACPVNSSSICLVSEPSPTRPLLSGRRSEEHTSELQSLRHLVC